jgi:hypothetical protein
MLAINIWIKSRNWRVAYWPDLLSVKNKHGLHTMIYHRLANLSEGACAQIIYKCRRNSFAWPGNSEEQSKVLEYSLLINHDIIINETVAKLNSTETDFWRRSARISRKDKVRNNVHSFSSLSYDRSKASSKASSPHSAIQSFLLQMRVSSPFLKVIQ